MIKTLAVAARDRARLGEILAIASRFGLDTLLARIGLRGGDGGEDTASNLPRRTRLAIEALGPTWRRSEEHTSELQSLMRISYAVFCLKKKTHKIEYNNT